VAPRLADELAACASGRELLDAGYADDVTVAAEVDTSDAVPVLEDGAYRSG
jgi:2-phosphosulfolactate phosphatase